MHWFVCNDARKRLRNADLGGSAFRAGRFFLYRTGRGPLLKVSWSFWKTGLNWLEASLDLGGEDHLASVTLILPFIAYLSFGIGLRTRWLSWWMLEDRVFAVKVGYVSSILRLIVFRNEWGIDCGMLDYYRRQTPRKYTDLQLSPGWEFVLRWPPVLTWLLGKETRHDPEILDQQTVNIEMDGRSFPATWTLQRYKSTRPRWPWAYRIWIMSYLKVDNPPQFAGKGENSWDCGDDGIWGMGSKELTPAGAVGDYIKAVLKNRERYGQPSEKAEVSR